MDLSLLMSVSPERGTQINLFLTRIIIFMSYSLVISIAGRQRGGKTFDLERNVLYGSQPPVVGFT